MIILEKIDFKKGRVDFNSFDIDFSRPLEEQIWNLNEDLLQVSYVYGDDVYILDVGWYPGNDLHGQLRVYVVKNQNWNEPIFAKQSKNETDLVADIKSSHRTN